MASLLLSAMRWQDIEASSVSYRALAALGSCMCLPVAPAVRFCKPPPCSGAAISSCEKSKLWRRALQLLLALQDTGQDSPMSLSGPDFSPESSLTRGEAMCYSCRRIVSKNCKHIQLFFARKEAFVESNVVTFNAAIGVAQA